MLEVNINNCKSQSEDVDKQSLILSQKLKRIFMEVICREKHPRTKIVISFEVLSEDSCLLSHMINLASYSLLEVGISIYDVVSSSVSSMNEKGQFVLDPDTEEFEKTDFSVVVAYLKNTRKISYFKTIGELGLVDSEKIQEVRELWLTGFLGSGFVHQCVC